MCKINTAFLAMLSTNTLNAPYGHVPHTGFGCIHDVAFSEKDSGLLVINLTHQRDIF
jgi:hypothetical protein